MQVLKCRDLTESPWKNGRGITRSIARGLCGDRPAWTLSRADVGQDGPFSDFAGMVRVLTVVSGGAMTLDFATSSLQALPWQPVRFDGGLKVQARLAEGPLTDLNLMFAPDLCTGEVLTHRGPLSQNIAPPDHGQLAFHVLAGEPAINARRLGPGDTAFPQGTAAALDLRDGDAVLQIRLTYLDQSACIRLAMAAR